jgi:hypothetical protein
MFEKNAPGCPFACVWVCCCWYGQGKGSNPPATVCFRVFNRLRLNYNAKLNAFLQKAKFRSK